MSITLVITYISDHVSYKLEMSTKWIYDLNETKHTLEMFSKWNLRLEQDRVNFAANFLLAHAFQQNILGLF